MRDKIWAIFLILCALIPFAWLGFLIWAIYTLVMWITSK